MEFDGFVRALRERLVKDPMDKASALYGVLESRGLKIHAPDYDKSKSKIYKELFLDLLDRCF